jgi:4-hydroxybenzoate polyprenyltransferase
LQYHVSKRLKEYLLLIRLPNVFTTPSNILVGYFAAVSAAEAAEGAHLLALMISSGMLYIAGIVLNDFFDIEIDKKERPSRPLPSGKISKAYALGIAIVALLIANSVALLVGPVTLAVSLALTLAIIAYDYRLKHSVVGPFVMGSTRFLNVILGASPVLLYIDGHSFAIVGAAASLLFFYVSSITLLSKKEVGNDRPNSIPIFLILFGVISATIILGMLLQLEWQFLIILSIFAAVLIGTFKQYLGKKKPSVQKVVRNMVISIIILDSVFVTGTAGLSYGLATLLLIAPVVVLAKKLYVT